MIFNLHYYELAAFPPGCSCFYNIDIQRRFFMSALIQVLPLFSVLWSKYDKELFKTAFYQVAILANCCSHSVYPYNKSFEKLNICL